MDDLGDMELYINIKSFINKGNSLSFKELHSW